MLDIFGFLAVPLGYVMRFIYDLVSNYFVAIFIFTFLVRAILFPLSIKNQKSQVDRARLAPKLERIQKKYAGDQKKIQEKQQELYQKNNVSMFGGCLPTIVSMLVLLSIINVIYKPLTYVQQMDKEVINTCATAVQEVIDADENITQKDKDGYKTKLGEKSYYRELYMLNMSDDDKYAAAIEKKLNETYKDDPAVAETNLTILKETKKDFKIFGVSLLDVPSEGGFENPNWPLWLLAVLSGVSALLSSLLSMHYSKQSMSEEQQKAGGCSTNAMMYMMPIFSLVISFSVPGGVVLYWIFSNLLALVQTVLLNKMYNPAKARAEAEAEYAERKRRKAEDRERLKQARLEEQAAWQKEENEKRAAARGEGKKKSEREAEKAAKEAAEAAEEKTDDLPQETVNDVPEE